MSCFFRMLLKKRVLTNIFFILFKYEDPWSGTGVLRINVIRFTDL